MCTRRGRGAHMPSNQISPKAGSAKMSTMVIVWGLAAGVDYLGLINGAATQLYNSLKAPLPSNDSGLRTLDSQLTAHFHIAVNSFSSLATIAVAAIPVAIIATIALGLGVRVRPTQGVFSSLLVVPGVVGLSGAEFLLIALRVRTHSSTHPSLLA